MTTLRKIILLKREAGDKRIARKISPSEGLEYLVENDFCNPHQLVRDERKKKLRKNFFEKLLGQTEVYLVNTVKPPLETHRAIAKLIKA